MGGLIGGLNTMYGNSFRLLAKRQRAGALQNASRISGIIVSRTASWTAAALRRFSRRHIHRCLLLTGTAIVLLVFMVLSPHDLISARQKEKPEIASEIVKRIGLQFCCMMRHVRYAFIIFLGVMLVGCSDVVTAQYATVDDARAQGAFERGWLPPVLPASASPDIS
jgi:hypothetical protein